MKRENIMNVRMSAEEYARLGKIAAEVGWSRSAVVRYGLSLAAKATQEMKAGDPPGNRRDVALGEES